MRSAYPARRSRSRVSCLGLLARFAVLLVLLLALYAVLLRPRVSAYVGQRVSAGLERQIEGQTGAALPTVVAALPKGEVTVTEAQANAYLGANPEVLAPIDNARVRFVPDQIQADFSAFGATSRASAGLDVRNGRLAVVNPRLDGPLSLAISVETLARTLEDQFNALLNEQPQAVRNVRIEKGQIVVLIE